MAAVAGWAGRQAVAGGAAVHYDGGDDSSGGSGTLVGACWHEVLARVRGQTTFQDRLAPEAQIDRPRLGFERFHSLYHCHLMGVSKWT